MDKLWGRVMDNINSVISHVRNYEKHGLDIDDIVNIANRALLESYQCENSYQSTLLYLMAIDILSSHDDGK
jgi:hypothetical protein